MDSGWGAVETDEVDEAGFQSFQSAIVLAEREYECKEVEARVEVEGVAVETRQALVLVLVLTLALALCMLVWLAGGKGTDIVRPIGSQHKPEPDHAEQRVAPQSPESNRDGVQVQEAGQVRPERDDDGDDGGGGGGMDSGVRVRCIQAAIKSRQPAQSTQP